MGHKTYFIHFNRATTCYFCAASRSPNPAWSSVRSRSPASWDVSVENTDGNVKSLLFVKENDQHSLLWSGPVSGSQRAASHFGVDEALPIGSLPAYLKGLQLSLFHCIDDNAALTGPAKDLLLSKGTSAIEALHRARTVKDAAEISLMVDVAERAAEAFKETMQWSRQTRYESHIAAKMEFECRLRGAEGLAYVPVVAGGPRANIIHYTRNDQIVKDDELILLDAGGKFHGYCTDITRTWPISGQFSQAQRELYEAVLRVQEACIKVSMHHGRPR